MKFLPLNRIALLATTAFFISCLFSCKKESSQPEQQTQTITEEEATTYSAESMETEGSFDDVEDISMTAANEEGITSTTAKGSETARLVLFTRLRLRIGDCANVTVSPNDSTYPKTVTIDFGNGCVGRDGKFRKGKIVLHFTGPIRRPGSVLTITLVDFQLNRAKIEGTKVITNLSENGNIKFTVQVNSGKVTYPNGRGYLYESLKNVKQVAGGTTNDVLDDIYSIEGRSKTTFNNGVVITLNTVDNLIKKVSCSWISEGTLKIKINRFELLLDYGFPGNGDCDNKALLLWNNNLNQKVILLP